MNNDPRGTMFQQGDIMRINNAYVEDVSCSNNSSGSILVSYAVREPGQAVSIQQIRLNLNRQTTVTNAAGQNSCICCIRKGMWVNVGFSPAMTRSIPPQSNAFWVAIQRTPQVPVPPVQPVPPIQPLPPVQPWPPVQPLPPVRPWPPVAPLPPRPPVQPIPPRPPPPRPQAESPGLISTTAIFCWEAPTIPTIRPGSTSPTRRYLPTASELRSASATSAPARWSESPIPMRRRSAFRRSRPRFGCRCCKVGLDGKIYSSN